MNSAFEEICATTWRKYSYTMTFEKVILIYKEEALL